MLEIKLEIHKKYIMAKIIKQVKQITDSDGQVFFPITHQSAVIDSDGNPLPEVFEKEHKQALEKINETKDEIAALREAHNFRLKALEEEVFYITATLSTNKSIYERTGSEISGIFTITPESNHMSAISQAVYTLTGTNVTIQADAITPSSLSTTFTIPTTNSTGYSSHKITVAISASLAGKDTLNYSDLSLTDSKSISFTQVAPSYIGWIPAANFNIGADGKVNPGTILYNMESDAYLQKVHKTSIAGKYVYKAVPADRQFTVLVPADSHFSGYTSILSNNIQVVLKDLGTVTLNGVVYKCIVNSSGAVATAGIDWIMTLS